MSTLIRSVVMTILFLPILMSCSKEEEPKACFKYSMQDMTIHFNAECSENVEHYNWDFDYDDETSLSKTPSIMYPKGYYVVTLIVENSSGETDEIQKDIQVPQWNCSQCRCNDGESKRRCHRDLGEHYDWRDTYEESDSCETSFCTNINRNYY